MMDILITSLYMLIIYILVHSFYVVHKAAENQRREFEAVVEFGHYIEVRRLREITSKSLDELSQNIDQYQTTCAMDPNENCVMCKRCPHRKECK